jgi:transcription elongation GreA/GreB family factor
MSSAFTREGDDGGVIEDVGERPVSRHRNLVTPRGLAQIELELENARVALARAEHAQDRRAIALAARDLNYWSVRRSSAETIKPNPDKSEVRFGHRVTVRTKAGQELTFEIVGEDEADPAHGSIPHVAPLARELLGKGVGDSVEVKRERAKIIKVA